MHPNPKFEQAVERLRQHDPAAVDMLEKFGAYCYEMGWQACFLELTKTEHDKLQHIGGRN